MNRVGIIGVGQSKFVRAYPGSIREMVFESFKAVSYTHLTLPTIYSV